ncbi:phage tail tape measure protein [Desulfobulbus rhabdoformis]|nr:phage tail tape measure protein [Desulfobulbus rhabdoformis]MBM9615777.1 phage tail tape measure protein [Desulfobulbus rhabdoformis]
MNDMEWATAFSGAMAQTVASFKTNGTQMADAIKNIGAVAAASNIPLNEQLAVLGQLQTTMPGSEAGTLYKAFIMKAAEAGDELGLSFTDTSGRLKGVVPILQEIKRQFPDLSNAAAQVKLKKAFGSDEAVKFLLQMSAGMESLEGNIQSVGRAMKTGTAVTEQMADAMNQDIGARFLLLRQQMANLSEILGRTLLPVVTPVINGVSRFILFLQRMAKSMPGVTRVVLGLSMALGTILVVAGAVTAAVGMVGLMLPAIKAGFVAISAALAGVGSAVATYFLPVTAIIAGVILSVYLLKRAWETNFGGIQEIITGAWNKVSLVFQGIRELVGSLSGGVGQMSSELAQKLESAGLLGFVVTVFKAYYRVREALAGLWGAFSHAFGRIRAILEPTVRTLMSAYAALASAVFSVVEIFGVAASATDGSSWRTFGTVIGTVAGVLLQGLAFALKIVAWNLSLIVRALAVVVRSVVWVGKVIVGSLVGAAKFIYKFLLPVRMIGEAFVAAGKIIYAVWQVLTGDISLLDGLKAIGGAVYDFLATPFRWARDVVVGVWNFISGIFTSIGRLVADAAGQIGQAILNLPIISTLRDLFATVRSFFAGDTTFFEAGKKLLITLGEGIWSAVTYPFTILKNALGKLRNLLPFSDAREGPLASLTASGSALLKTLADGMSLTQTLPAKVFGFAARGILSAAAGAWQQIKTAGGNLMDAASAPFRMAGKLWDGLTTGAQTVAAKAGAIFGGLKQSLFGDTPELAITPPKVNAWDALATGAVTVRDRIVATLSAVPGTVGRIFTSAGAEGQTLWQRLSSGASAGIQAIKDRSAGIANGLLSSARAMLGVQTPIPQVAEQKQPLGVAQPAESIGQRIIESVLSLVPRLDERLVPKALSAMLMLQPVMATAAPHPQQMNGTVQTVATAVEPVSKSYIQPFAVEPAPEKGDASPAPAGIERPKTVSPTPIAKPLQSGLAETVPSERLIIPARTAPATPMRGEDAGPGLRELLESLLSRLDGLADRPVELSVTTNIDGRKVAEAVYKDLRERKIRNYETL